MRRSRRNSFRESTLLQCTSRMPSPSPSRANSPRLRLTVACPDRGGPAGCTRSSRRCTPSPPPWWRAGPWRQRARPNCSGIPPGTPPARAAGHPGDRRPVGVPGAVALRLVGPPSRWVVGVDVRDPFSPLMSDTSRRPWSGRPATRVVGGVQRAGLDLMPQLQQMLSADPDLAGELRGGDALGDAAEDQEDLGRAEVCPLPNCSCEQIEHPSASLSAVVDDRGVGVTAVDIEPSRA